jgi:hypothetical protein
MLKTYSNQDPMHRVPAPLRHLGWGHYFDPLITAIPIPPKFFKKHLLEKGTLLL